MPTRAEREPQGNLVSHPCPPEIRSIHFSTRAPQQQRNSVEKCQIGRSSNRNSPLSQWILHNPRFLSLPGMHRRKSGASAVGQNHLSSLTGARSACVHARYLPHWSLARLPTRKLSHFIPVLFPFPSWTSLYLNFRHLPGDVNVSPRF